MSYDLIVAGLSARFATISGLTVLEYEPTDIQTTPLLYSLFESTAYEGAGQVKARRYKTLHRLVLPWQDVEQAEVELHPWPDTIPDAVAADRTLGGALTRGTAAIVDAAAGWHEVGGVTYRTIDFYSEVLEKS